MKKFLLFLVVVLVPFFGFAQCTTNNATDCECLDSSQQDCDLLPDITVSWGTGLNGHTEYPPGEGLQDGEINYPGNWFGITPAIEAMGRIRVSVKTPNIGVGALNIRGMDDDGYRWMICYDSGVADTFQIYDPDWGEDTYCPDGSNPKHLTWQRVYHKNPDGSVSYWDKMIGTMEYHPTHGHMHFDRWVQMSLRYIDENNMENPLEWEVAADGAKIGFCVMDLGSCGGGGCMDDETVYNQGTELYQSDFPNYGFGGGSYGCSPISQGISSGYTDTYGEHLDGMFINLPPTICNGDYAVVMDVPADLLVESNNNNNYAWFPVTLTEQESASSMPIDASNSVLCEGDVITLSVSNSSSNHSFLWSTGDVGESIEITEPGSYSVDITDSFCGSEITSYFTVEGNDIIAPTSEGAFIMEGETATLEAVSDYLVNWYDENGALVGSGNSFVTPVLYADATYFMSASEMSGSASVGPLEHEGENEYSASGTNGYVEFDALGDFVLTSVDVYTNQPGERIIVLLDSDGNTVEEHTEFIPSSDDEPHTIVLDFDIAEGDNYRLTTDGDLNDVSFGGENPQLKRTDGDDADLSYPYVLNGVVSLNDSPYGTEWYYYFYNWIVVSSVECHMVPVEVYVMEPIYGCTNSIACNYNSQATFNDGTCEFLDGFCETCEDGIVIDNDTDNDGVCDENEVIGCTDPNACNYDNLSTENDNSCVYLDNLCETCEDGIIIDNDTDNDGVCDGDEIFGCQNLDACNYNPLATNDNGNCLLLDGVCETCEDGMIIDNDTDNDGVCDNDELLGCTNSIACNYNSLATDDDGTCEFLDGICETCVDGIIIDNDSDDDGVCDGNEVVGCQDMTACNYDALSTDAGSCTYVDGICESCEDGLIVDNDSDNDGICDDDEIETYSCINTACIDPGDNTGTYTSLADCETDCHTSSINNESVNQFLIFPNPTNGIVNIVFNQISSLESIQLSIMNSLGELVCEENAIVTKEFTKEVDLSNQPKGVYTLQITTPTGGINKKIVLQ